MYHYSVWVSMQTVWNNIYEIISMKINVSFARYPVFIVEGYYLKLYYPLYMPRWLLVFITSPFVVSNKSRREKNVNSNEELEPRPDVQAKPKRSSAMALLRMQRFAKIAVHSQRWKVLWSTTVSGGLFCSPRRLMAHFVRSTNYST